MRPAYPPASLSIRPHLPVGLRPHGRPGPRSRSEADRNPLQ
ncbi:hypothetical protein [Azospirillum argentinense]